MQRRTNILLLAAEAQTDVRTAAKALDLGPDVIRGVKVRQSLILAAIKLGIALGSVSLVSGKVRAT